MTGPGPGKIKLNAKVFLKCNNSFFKVNDIEVYLHLKGWSRARVTHLDVESSIVNEYIVRPKQGFYAKASYNRSGLWIHTLKALKPCTILIVEEDVLPKVFSLGEETWCYIGGKIGGMYIGFRKKYIELLEQIAYTKWGIKPKPDRQYKASLP